jgi:hypothetical protein
LIVAAAAAPSLFVLLHHLYERQPHSRSIAGTAGSQTSVLSVMGILPSTTWSFPRLHGKIPPPPPPLQSPDPPSEESQVSSAQAAEAAAQAAAKAAARVAGSN